MTKSCGSTQLRRSERNAEGHRGPTVLLEIEGSGLPTDPTFDPVGGYIFGCGPVVGAALARPAVDREAPTAALGYVQTWFAMGPSR